MGFSVVLPLAVTGVGAFLLIRLGAFFIMHPIKTAKRLLPTLRDSSSRRALSLALAGTLGVGNVFGVCAGIIVGGAGCVFWMLVSSLFSMIIKYAECVLSFDCIKGTKGGMHCVLLTVFRRFGGAVSVIYALLCALLALFMGSAMQSNALSDAAHSSFGLSPVICAAVLLMFTLTAVRRGDAKIEKITAKLIPLTTIIYILLTLSVILVNFSELGRVVRDIISQAFSFRAAGGGAIGFLSSAPIREGYARGVLSNEAGTGTSSLAHTRSRERTPAEAGLAGMCEVFFDTTLLCTLTALAVLCSAPPATAYSSPMSLIGYAIEHSLGRAYLPLLTLSVFIFAYSTVICWYYYGAECVGYLFGSRMRTPYTVIFLFFTVLGACLAVGTLVALTDIIILAMTVLTLSAIVYRSGRICELTREGLGIRQSRLIS